MHNDLPVVAALLIYLLLLLVQNCFTAPLNIIAVHIVQRLKFAVCSEVAKLYTCGVNYADIWICMYDYHLPSCFLLFVGVHNCTSLVINSLFPSGLLAVTLSTATACVILLLGFNVRVISAITDSTLWHERTNLQSQRVYRQFHPQLLRLCQLWF